VDGEVGGALEERLFDLFHEEPLAADVRERPVLDPVSAGDHLQLGDDHLRIERRETLQERATLREREGRASGGHRHRRALRGRGERRRLRGRMHPSKVARLEGSSGDTLVNWYAVPRCARLALAALLAAAALLLMPAVARAH